MAVLQIFPLASVSAGIGTTDYFRTVTATPIASGATVTWAAGTWSTTTGGAVTAFSTPLSGAGYQLAINGVLQQHKNFTVSASKVTLTNPAAGTYTIALGTPLTLTLAAVDSATKVAVPGGN